MDKYLQVTVKINKASDLPAKSTHKTMVSYDWLDGTPHATDECEKSNAPQFNYRKDHMIKITSDLIESLMLKTLQVKVSGMTESKKKEVAKAVNRNQDDSMINDNSFMGGISAGGGYSTASASAAADGGEYTDRIAFLEAQNKMLLEQLEAARKSLEKYEGKKVYDKIELTPSSASKNKGGKTCVIF